jgi:hypothetical protein
MMIMGLFFNWFFVPPTSKKKVCVVLKYFFTFIKGYEKIKAHNMLSFDVKP